MTLFWSPIPFDMVFAGYHGSAPELTEMQVGDVTMLCSPAEHGMGRIERLISPRPADYLRADWQPGSLVPLWPTTPEAGGVSRSPSSC